MLVCLQVHLLTVLLHCWMVGGLAGGVLVVYCYGKRQSEHHPPPCQPAPIYEDIVISNVKGEVELQLRDNMAYGQVKKVVFIIILSG